MADSYGHIYAIMRRRAATQARCVPGYAPVGSESDLLERPPLLGAGNLGDASRGLAAAQLRAPCTRRQFLGGGSALRLRTLVILLGLDWQRPTHHVVDEYLRGAGRQHEHAASGGVCRRCERTPPDLPAQGRPRGQSP